MVWGELSSEQGDWGKTHVHGLVDLTALDDLPGDLDVVVVKVGLDLVLVDRVDDWGLVWWARQISGSKDSLVSITIRTRCHRL